MYGTNMGSSLPHSKGLDHDLKHRRDADPGLGTQLGSCFVADPWVPSVALQHLHLLVVKEAPAAWLPHPCWGYSVTQEGKQNTVAFLQIWYTSVHTLQLPQRQGTPSDFPCLNLWAMPGF